MSDLSNIPRYRLEQELEARGWLNEDDAGYDKPEDIVHSEIREAGHRFARGDIADALYYLERALPDTFRGLADVVRQPR